MPAINLAPSILFSIGPWHITTTFILQIIVSLLIIWIFVYTVRHWKTVPGKFQLLVETLVKFAYNQVDKVTNDPVRTHKIFPLIFTFFIFIMISNLFTLVPGMGAIFVRTSTQDISLFRSVLADYSMVLVLTMIVIVLSQVLFIFYNGFRKYFHKWFNFSSPMAFALGIMDIISEFAKILSLSFRLFGNVFAGEVLAIVIGSLVPFFVPIPFLVLNIFSSVIQAYVFSLLAAIFINSTMEVVN